LLIKENYRATFAQFVPQGAVDYCLDLWWNHKFEFKITKERQTKLGDFRFHTQRNTPIITVNNNLNKYNFLITYIHEVAHYVVYQKHKHKVQAHGLEWKSKFRDLLLPLISTSIFPDDVLRPLARYIKNPKASSYSDPKLMLALQRYDTNQAEGHVLQSLKPTEKFIFNSREFELIEMRRTRVLCMETKTGKRYLISGIARVQKLDSA
jgi:hypothetical protein